MMLVAVSTSLSHGFTISYEISYEYNLEVVELKGIRPDDIGCSIKQLEPWVHHEISSEYDLKVLHLERIGSDEVGGGVN